MSILDIFMHPVAIVIILLAVVFKLCAGNTGPIPQHEGEQVTELDSGDMYDTVTKEEKDKVVIIDAYATWCGPCRTAAPAFGKLSMEYDSSTIKSDNDT